MSNERVTLRNLNPDVKGTWDCPVKAVDGWRPMGWVPVEEVAETPEEVTEVEAETPSEVAEPRPARKSREENKNG